MDYIIGIGVLLLVAGVAIIGALKGAWAFETVRQGRYGEQSTTVRHDYNKVIGVVAGLVLILGGGVWTAFNSLHIVEPTEVGVVYEFGEIVGQIGEGTNFLPPWQSVKTEKIGLRKDSFTDLDAASFETQDVFLDLTLNWQVDPIAVQQLYRTVGVSFYDVLIPSRVLQHSKAEIVKYSTVEVTQQREQIRKNIEEALKADLSGFSVRVVSVQIDSIRYNPEFTAAIERKQVAQQNALEAENRADSAVAEARGKADSAIQAARGAAESQRQEADAEAYARRELAKADADAVRLAGLASAEANTAIALSLTQNLIDFEAIKKLEGVSIAYLPADGTTILDPTRVFTGRGN